MLSQRSLTKLSSAERQLLRQWQRSGKCARCFHASLRSRASSDPAAASPTTVEGVPHNNEIGTKAPPNGPSRKQRSAMVGEEIRLLQRDLPNLGPSKLPPKQDEYAVDPTIGETAGEGRMGENMSPSREGPLAQGRASNVRAYDEEGMREENQSVSGAPIASGQVEAPASGGQSVMDAESDGTVAATIAEVSARPEEQEAEEDEELDQDEEEDDGVPEQPDLVTGSTPSQRPEIKPAGRRIPPPGVPYAPKPPTLESLTQSGAGTSTIAANNFSALIQDRRALISTKKFNSILRSAPVRKQLVDNMVKGIYDEKGVLSKEASKGREGIMEAVERMTMKNGTFLAKDREKFLMKVEELLPKAGAVPQRSSKKQGG
ncbi:rRNA processing [Teratosphaeria destructans]|uniref:rRNA processing n=1 Tax=Teratosphaeria destructans TaxID=418781 RepID=A0A9W7SJG3_9PEZI|nr:rRNA processing [Teratosphaeria destructans]